MNSFNNNSLPIQSKSPMLLSKQINRPNIPAIKSLRMSDHTEYSKSLKINNSQSSSNIVNKRNTLDSLHHHNLTDEIPHNYSNYCTKHPKKKAKYYNKNEDCLEINSKQTELFCSKCALDLAMKGIKVEKFLNKEEKYRKNIIDDFLSKINDTKAFFNQNKINLLKQKSEALTLQAFHNENIKDFFSKLETLLQNEKEKLIAEYQTDSSSNMNKAELYFSNIQNITFEIDRFQDDINQNYAKIINKMELEPFLEIMQKYEEKLQSLIRESFQIEKPIISYKTHDFKKPCKDFLENIRNLLHVFLGIDVKTLEIHDEPSKNLSSEQLTHNRDIFKDKTNEITNSGLRKTSLANKETQEKILQEFSSQTQRNIQSSNNNNEHIYSSIINTMSVKKTNNMKGFFSGLGKNFKTFNENNSLVGNNKAKHITGNFDTRNSTGHVPMTQNQTKAK